MIKDVPDGWEIKELGQCVDILDNQRIPLNNQDRENRIKDKDISTLYPYYGATQQVGYIDDYIFDEELILLGEDGVMFYDKDKPKAYIISGKTWVNNHAHVLRAKSEITMNKYLLNYLNTFHYKGFVSGATRLKLNQSRMAQIPIPLPPLPQQEKIVKVLDASSGLIEKQKELIENYDLFLKSKFIEMFGDPIQNPMGWEVEKLNNLTEQYKGAMRTGPFGSSLKKEFYVKDGYKIYGQEQVIKNNFDYGNYYIDAERYETLKGYSIKENDILISLVGTFGKIAIVPKLFEAGIINPRLMKISLDTNLYNPVFFKNLFYTEGFKAQLLNFSHGGTMGILNLTILKELKYINPPLELQNKFASIVEKTDAIKAKETQKLEHLETLHSSLIDKAFKGEIQ